jgi:hypothetical protein
MKQVIVLGGLILLAFFIFSGITMLANDSVRSVNYIQPKLYAIDNFVEDPGLWERNVAAEEEMAGM